MNINTIFSHAASPWARPVQSPVANVMKKLSPLIEAKLDKPAAPKSPELPDILKEKKAEDKAAQKDAAKRAWITASQMKNVIECAEKSKEQGIKAQIQLDYLAKFEEKFNAYSPENESTDFHEYIMVVRNEIAENFGDLDVIKPIRGSEIQCISLPAQNSESYFHKYIMGKAPDGKWTPDNFKTVLDQAKQLTNLAMDNAISRIDSARKEAAYSLYYTNVNPTVSIYDRYPDMSSKDLLQRGNAPTYLEDYQNMLYKLENSNSDLKDSELMHLYINTTFTKENFINEVDTFKRTLENAYESFLKNHPYMEEPKIHFRRGIDEDIKNAFLHQFDQNYQGYPFFSDNVKNVEQQRSDCAFSKLNTYA